MNPTACDKPATEKPFPRNRTCKGGNFVGSNQHTPLTCTACFFAALADSTAGPVDNRIKMPTMPAWRPLVAISAKDLIRRSCVGSQRSYWHAQHPPIFDGG